MPTESQSDHTGVLGRGAAYQDPRLQTLQLVEAVSSPSQEFAGGSFGLVCDASWGRCKSSPQAYPRRSGVQVGRLGKEQLRDSVTMNHVCIQLAMYICSRINRGPIGLCTARSDYPSFFTRASTSSLCRRFRRCTSNPSTLSPGPGVYTFVGQSRHLIRGRYLYAKCLLTSVAGTG